MLCLGLALLTLVSMPAQEPARAPALTFIREPSATRFDFEYTHVDDPYLASLREQYDLGWVINGAATEVERLRMISSWVHSRWSHAGQAVSSKTDPVSILEAAEAGMEFGCMEYSIVLAGCLNAIGIPSRMLALNTRGSQFSSGGGGARPCRGLLAELE